EPAVCVFQSLWQGDVWLPAEIAYPADIQQFARRTVGLGGVEADLAAKSNHAGDQVGQFLDGEVVACADIDVGNVLPQHIVDTLLLQLHDMQAGRGEVVDV